jgi:hypothetical protein
MTVDGQEVKMNVCIGNIVVVVGSAAVKVVGNVNEALDVVKGICSWEICSGDVLVFFEGEEFFEG